MNDNYINKFGIKIDKIHGANWSIGICLSHSRFNDDCAETYIFINLFKWTISIGKLLMEVTEDA